jgi:hypothetical protein
LEQRQEREHIPNPTCYLIGIMRNLAVEGMLKGWNVAQMRAEDEEKHALALRSAARADHVNVAREGNSPAGEESPLAAGGEADVDPPASPTPEVGQAGQQEVSSVEVQGSKREEAGAKPPQPEEERKESFQCELPHRDGRARQIWQSTLQRIQPKISQAMFNTWFAGTSGQTLCRQVLTVAVRTTFNRSHLETRFHDLVLGILCDLVGPDAEVRFVLETEEEKVWNPNSI